MRFDIILQILRYFKGRFGEEMWRAGFIAYIPLPFLEALKNQYGDVFS